MNQRIKIILFLGLMPFFVFSKEKTALDDSMLFRYHVTEDPSEFWFTMKNIELLFAFMYDDIKYRRLLPDYGYKYSDIHDRKSLYCDRDKRTYNKKVGRSFIARYDFEQKIYVALPIRRDTGTGMIQKFLDESMESLVEKSIKGKYALSDDYFEDWMSFGEICNLFYKKINLSGDDSGIVIVTEYAIFYSHTYRLLPEHE